MNNRTQEDALVIRSEVNSYLITEEIRGLVGAATSVKGSMRMRNYLQLLLFKWQQPKLYQLEHFQALNFACDKLVELGDSFIH